METLTHSQLFSAVTSRAGMTFIGIDSLSDARALKNGNPFSEKTILKQSRFVGHVGASYENAVIREAAKQGIASDFESAPLPWGSWEIPNKIISHKGERYLRTQTIAKVRKTRPAVVKYRDITGKFLSYNEVEPFLPKPSFSALQSAEGLASEVEQVHIRTFKFSSLLRVRINGKTYKVIPDEGWTPPEKVSKPKKQRVFDINSKEEAAEKVNEILHRAVLDVIASGDSRQ